MGSEKMVKTYCLGYNDMVLVDGCDDANVVNINSERFLCHLLNELN